MDSIVKIGGDTVSLRSLYDAHVQYLSAVCNRYISDRDEAKDVLQESLIKIFSKIEDFDYRGPGSLRAWMRRILVNEALMHLRRKNRSFEVPITEEIQESTEEEPDFENISMETLQEMIRSLPAGYRTVFNLYVFEEKSHKEIASLLGISENTSYSQFSRAKSLLVRKIKEYTNHGR